MDLPRLYYTLPKAAAQWGVSEDDLLHLAAAGELRLSVQHYGEGHNLKDDCVLIDGYVQLYADDCQGILEFGYEKYAGLIRMISWEGEPYYITDKYQGERHVIRTVIGQKYGHDKVGKGEFYLLEKDLCTKSGISTGIPVYYLTIRNTSDLLILPDEFKRVEAKYFEIPKSESDEKPLPQTSIDLPDDGRPKLFGITGICRHYIEGIKGGTFPENKKAKDRHEWRTIRPLLEENGYLRQNQKKQPWTTPSALENVFFKKK